jgi:hypothetical protein
MYFNLGFLFTFPSQSMALYQRPESKGHNIAHRNENYDEALNNNYHRTSQISLTNRKKKHILVKYGG